MSALIECLQSHRSILRIVIDEKKKKLDVKTIVDHRIYDVLASQSYETDVLSYLKKVSTPELEILI